MQKEFYLIGVKAPISFVYGGGWIQDAKPNGPLKGSVANEISSSASLQKIRDSYSEYCEWRSDDQPAQTITDRFPYIRQIRIVASGGNVIKSLPFTNKLATQRVSLAGIASGVYIVSVFDGKVWYNQKLMVVK